MKLALFQMKMSEDMILNQNKSIQAIEAAAEKGADLILFPEIQHHRFFPQYEGRDVTGFDMSIDHPYVKQMQEACRKYGIMAAPNIYLLEKGKKYDATLLINSDGKIIGTQKMVHIAQAAGFYEQDYYTPADDGFKVFDTPFGKIGIVVCFDRHYPESIRTEALKGADLILIPTANTTAEPSEMFEWEVRVQSFQNSVLIAMCNRVGEEGDCTFSGESLVADANGTVIAKADDKEGILYALADTEGVAEIRKGKNYTQLRREECYTSERKDL